MLEWSLLTRIVNPTTPDVKEKPCRKNSRAFCFVGITSRQSSTTRDHALDRFRSCLCCAASKESLQILIRLSHRQKLLRHVRTGGGLECYEFGQRPMRKTIGSLQSEEQPKRLEFRNASSDNRRARSKRFADCCSSCAYDPRQVQRYCKSKRDVD